MKKALIVSSVASMIEQFNMPNIASLLNKGYEVHIATNFIDYGNLSSTRIKEFIEELDQMGIKRHQVDFPRNPQNIRKLVKSYFSLKQVLKLKFNLVHSHSPVGGVVARISANKYRKNGLKSIYTAHGFHFSKKSSFFSFLFFFPIEFICSNFTDLLITINNEDYCFAKSNLRARDVIKINGVGVDNNIFNTAISEKNKMTERKQMNIAYNDLVSICVGEINRNKNQMFILKSYHETLKMFPSHKILFVGDGALRHELEQYIIQNDLIDNAFILGYRKNVRDLMAVSDIIISASYREGLPVNIIEGMAMGLTPIVSNCRGNIDLVSNENGFLFENEDKNELINIWRNVLESHNIREELKNKNIIKSRNYSIDYIMNQINEYYEL